MAFTSHGHQVIGTPAEANRPEKVARCGGPSTCSGCATDAYYALRIFLTENPPPNANKKHWDEQGNLHVGETLLKPVGWMIFGGPNDQKIVQKLEDIERGVPHGSFTRVYIVLGTD